MAKTAIMLLNILPSTFPLPRDVGHEHNAFHHDHRGADVSSHDNILQDIEEEFGLGTSDPFKKIQEEMKSSILNDPFDITIGASFGSTDNAYGFYEDTQNDALFDGWYDHMDSCDLGDEDGDAVCPARKKRSPNLFPYKFGDVFQANWYSKFLAPDVREKTYALSSRDRYGHFRCLFRMPLHKIDELVDIFLEKGWIRKTKHCNDDARLKVKAQLLIMGTLNILGHNNPSELSIAAPRSVQRNIVMSFIYSWIRCSASRMSLCIILGIQKSYLKS